MRGRCSTEEGYSVTSGLQGFEVGESFIIVQSPTLGISENPASALNEYAMAA